MQIRVRLAEKSIHEVKGEVIYKYQFVQANPSSSKPWLPNALEIRSLEPLDFAVEREYTVDVD